MAASLSLSAPGLRVAANASGRMAAGRGRPSSVAAAPMRSRHVAVRASEGGRPMEDWGARDPFPGEIETNFGEKGFGWADTEHQILMPKGMDDVSGLAIQNCVPLPPNATALEEPQARELLKRVVAWRLLPLATANGTIAGGAALMLQGQWRVRDEAAGEELQSRIQQLAGEQQQPQEPLLRFDDGSRSVVAELHSQALGGLSVNDFIFAAKIDKIDIKDLVPKARFWA